ncbi:MAG: tetratricopeptide repeat protein [bacterium]
MRVAALVLMGFFVSLSLAPTLDVYRSTIEMTPSALAMTGLQNRNSISGHVFSTSRAPIGQLYVELQDDFNSTVQRVRTDNSGFYAFNGLVTGVYQVVVQTYGTDYLPQTQRVQIDSLSPTGRGSQSLQVDFTLRDNNADKTAGLKRTGVVFAQEIPVAAQRAYDLAVSNLESGKDYDQGMKELIKAIEIFPNYYLALERLGTEYLNQRRYQEAIPILGRALDVNPKSDMSSYLLGVARYQLNDISGAIDSLSRAISIYRSSVNYQMWLAKALWKDGRAADAEAHFKEAYKLGGKRVAIVHMYLAQLYDKQKRYSEEAMELALYLKEEPQPSNEAAIRTAIDKLRRKAK